MATKLNWDKGNTHTHTTRSDGDTSMSPGYKLKPGDAYVRARVVSSAGDFAWTQPLFQT